MNLRRVQYFLAVVDAGTVTAAAESMHVAQPALSRQIKTLERELKLELFETQGNRLILTHAGHAFVPAARRLIVATRSLIGAADALRTGRVPSLTVAATSASVRGFLAPFIASMAAIDPVIITRETSHFAMGQALLHGSDFAVSPAAPEPGLMTFPLGSVALNAYVARSHEWAEGEIEELPVDALSGQDVIVPSHRSASRFILDDALNQKRLNFQSITECDDGQTIVALAVAGHGVGITTELRRYEAHRIRIVASAHGQPSEIIRLPLHAAWPPGHFAEGTILSIASRLKRFLDEQEITLPSIVPCA